MKIKEVHEGAEPKLPGAPGGISIMTPQQFVAKADDMPEEDVAEGKPGLWANIHAKRERIKHGSGERMRTPGSKGAPTSDALKKSATEGVAEGLEEAVGGNYLYHGRSVYDAKDVLASGYIPKAKGPQKATQAQTKLPTVSVTRDWGYASESNAQTQMAGIGRDVVFVLDRNAVESNFKTLGTSQSQHIKGLALNPYLTKSGEARSQNTDSMARANAKGKSKYAEPTAKAGGEFEEAVVVPKGVLPLKGTMVGFWVNPKSELMKDPTIMNDPRRLDMVRPNQFVKVQQTQGVAEGSLNEFAGDEKDFGGGGEPDDAWIQRKARLILDYVKKQPGMDLVKDIKIGYSFRTNTFQITGKNKNFNQTYEWRYVYHPGDEDKGIKPRWVPHDSMTTDRPYPPDQFTQVVFDEEIREQGVAEGQEHLDRIRSLSGLGQINESEVKTAYHKAYLKHGGGGRVPNKAASDKAYDEIGKTHGPKALAQLQKLHGTYTDAAHKAGSVYKDVDEATKLPAQTRDLGGQEFQDYMKRIVGSPDLDKAGNVKVDKKGNEKYTTGKTKSDRFKLPYIHRSSVVEYLGPDGRTYDEDKIKQTLSIRPKALLKQNEKMKHSNGEFEQFFNIGFAALTGIALDQTTNNLIVVNTCPGAGSCKVDCFAMKGGKIQFKAAWQSDGRILTYLLNDPDGFFNQLSNEISVESQAAAKGDKKFPNGWQVTVRWHDAGDFFSPEYLDMALKMAAKHPDVRFYAYTKMAGAALAKKPDNFIINWSEGANTTQEKQVKAQDPKLDTTKNSRIVPEKLFYDLLAKDEKGNLKKTADGAWQPASPEALADMKQRIAKEYGISASSILSYTEYMAKRNAIPAGMKYNVIVAPGEGDVSANDPGVLSTLLLRH